VTAANEAKSSLLFVSACVGLSEKRDFSTLLDFDIVL